MSLEVTIEIPKRSFYKYEMKGLDLVIDRILNNPFPENYGFIKTTLSPDGDPLDAFVLARWAMQPTSKVAGELVGVLKCVDNDKRDDKLIVNFGIPEEHIKPLIFNIIDYLETYKPGFGVLGYGELEEAEKILQEAKLQYLSTWGFS